MNFQKIKKLPIQRMAMIIGLVVMLLFFSFASQSFFTVSNVNNILLSTMINGILACGAIFVIVSGGIDVSVGTSMSLVSVMLSVFIVWWGFPTWLGIICGLSFGMLVGICNGIMVTKMRITPFIATLGMQMVTSGLAIVITDGSPVYFNEVTGYQNIALGSPLKDWLTSMGIGDFMVKNGVIIMFAFVIVFGIILAKTRFGRYLYAIGNNKEATRLSGIRVERWELMSYIVAGLMSAVAAVLMTSRMNTAYPSLGTGYEMQSIAACVIGGASLAGGKGSMKGTVLGAFIMSVLTNGLRLMSVPTEWQKVLTGLIIILAVFFDMASKEKRKA